MAVSVDLLIDFECSGCAIWKATKMKPLNAVLVLFLLVACGDDQTVTGYSLQKVNSAKNYGHDWLPLNPSTFTVRERTVVSNTIGSLSKYKDCIIQSPEDWECRYSDGSGRVGFRGGDYWLSPLHKGRRIVTRWEYNIVRCKWAIKDSAIWGAISCGLGWK